MQSTTTPTSDLSIAEALILQEPNSALGHSALKLTMMDPLARRVLTLRQEETKGRFGRMRTTDRVLIASDAARKYAHQPHVHVVIDAIATAGKNGDPPTMQQVIALNHGAPCENSPTTESKLPTADATARATAV